MMDSWISYASETPRKLVVFHQPIWKICTSQIGSFPFVGMKIKNVWKHHLVTFFLDVNPAKSFPTLTRKKEGPTTNVRKGDHGWSTLNHPRKLQHTQAIPRLPTMTGTFCYFRQRCSKGVVQKGINQRCVEPTTQQPSIHQPILNSPTYP